MQCDIISLFVDGCLNEHQADIIRHHLGQCETCEKELQKHSELFMRILKPPILQSRLAEAVDDLLNTIQTVEHQAIFEFLNLGVTFSQMRLYRILSPMETGIMVDGEIACTIKVKWPELPDIMYRNSPAIDIKVTYLPPFEHLKIE